MIETSINIERNRYARLKKAAELTVMSETELLSLLLYKSRRLFGNTAVTGQTVRYQRDYNPSDFVIHHICINETDYEFATGRRYLFKISVSFILALAIDAYLTEIIYEWTKKRAAAEKDWERYRTNIHYTVFQIDHFITINSENWIIPWPLE